MSLLLNLARKTTKLLTITALVASCALIGLEEEDTTTTSSSEVNTTPIPTHTVPEILPETAVSAVAGNGAIQSTSQISVLTPKSTNSGAERRNLRISKNLLSVIDTNSFATSSDYINDTTSTYVFEEAANALQDVNDILCQIQQSRIDLMLNEGPYKAQIDRGLCDRYMQYSGSGGVNYNTWTMNVTRDANQPMITKVWVPQGDTSTIKAKFLVYQPPSDVYPLGFFNLNLQSTNNEDGTEDFKGFMRTLKVGSANHLEFYLTYGNGLDKSVNVEIQNNNSGQGSTKHLIWEDNSPSRTENFNFSYDSDYFFKQKQGDDPVCLDRNNYFESAWKYGVYSANGERVNVNAGFPIKVNSNNEDHYGYIGYYGLWMPDLSIGNNDTVTRIDFTKPDNTGSDYTLKSYGGKLYKHTKQEVSLGDIRNIPLAWQDHSNGSVEKRVYWDGITLKYDATRSKESDWQWIELSPPVSFSLTLSNAPYGFWFWSQALGGDGRIMLNYSGNSNSRMINPITDETKVIFYTKEVVFPGDNVPQNFTCFQRCPEFNNLADGFDNGTQPSIYKQNIWNDNVSGSAGYTYSFSTNASSGMILKDSDNKSIVFDSSNTNLQWGLFSGELIEDNLANRQLMTCDWDNNTICTWRAREKLSTFYSWESGEEDWKKLNILVDSSETPVKFDPPLMVKYIHSGDTSNSGKNYDGGKFYLEYRGFGDLWGIPYFCTDVNGNRATCNEDSKYVNEFLIPEGSTVTRVAGGNSAISNESFVVKPLEVEQAMKQVDPANCTAAGLSLDGVSLPDISGYTTPDIGPKPLVEGPPAVVSGVRQD